LSIGQDSEAEISFRRGLDIAIRQGARLFQARLETEMDAAAGAASSGAGLPDLCVSDSDVE
jgi:hypothetical protein